MTFIGRVMCTMEVLCIGIVHTAKVSEIKIYKGSTLGTFFSFLHLHRYSSVQVAGKLWSQLKL